MLRSVLFDKVADAVAEVIGFKEKELDDEVAHLSLIALMTSHRLCNSNAIIEGELKNCIIP